MSRLNEGSKRILTTHTGSLPRPDALSALLFARMTKQPYDPADMQAQTKAAVAATVRKQMDVEIDIVSDGEQTRQHFVTTFIEHLDGVDFEKRETVRIRDRYDASVPTVVGAVARRKPVFVEDAKFLRQQTTQRRLRAASVSAASAVRS
jgi:5-methyltetrahydropteroyltriglutamate--homocysteine methyltransferase